MSTSTVPSYTGLFPEIKNLDEDIFRDLAKLEDVTETRPTIATCTLNLPAGEISRLNGVQYGIFLLMRRNGQIYLFGIRTERHHGQAGYHIALRTLKMALSAVGYEEPNVVEFRYDIRYV